MFQFKAKYSFLLNKILQLSIDVNNLLIRVQNTEVIAQQAIDAARHSEAIVNERTIFSIDVINQTRKDNKIMVSGHYNGKNFVQLFSIKGAEFEHLVDDLRHMTKYSMIQHIDNIPGITKIVLHVQQEDNGNI